MIRRLLIATTFFLAACAAPYNLPIDDRADIAARISNFERAFVRGNTTEVINVVPPRIIQAIAEKGGVSEKALRRQMAQLTREATAKIKIISFGMALEQATFFTTPSGRPYGLIPTQTLIQTPRGQKLQSNSSTLTLEENGEWYLIRIDDLQQIGLLQEVYPEFKGVTLPKGTMKVMG